MEEASANDFLLWRGQSTDFLHRLHSAVVRGWMAKLPLEEEVGITSCSVKTDTTDRAKALSVGWSSGIEMSVPWLNFAISSGCQSNSNSSSVVEP